MFTVLGKVYTTIFLSLLSQILHKETFLSGVNWNRSLDLDLQGVVLRCIVQQNQFYLRRLTCEALYVTTCMSHRQG